ncbi:MAG TPA: pilus assembly protein N-terminal domain-containing protein [Rhizomicrobium sp.]
MVRAYRTSIFLLALPLAALPASAQVCHPTHHHHVAHMHKVALHESGVGVVIDQAREISFPQPVKTVFVGNPVIADISMIDSQHAFVLGKTFGVTNMIALTADGKQISDQQVVVYNNATAMTINRGADQYNYMCTRAHCETAPRPGDPQTFVTTTEGTATQHETSASGAGTNAPTNQSASN